jgi:hypothetical protein
MKMKKIGLFLMAAVLLTAFILPVQAQTFGVNPYMRVIPICINIDTVRTANDSTRVFYIPFKCEILQIQAIASTVTDTVDIVLGQTSPASPRSNSTSTCTARLLTANVVAYGNPTTRTNASAGTYWRVIAKVGGDLGNIAYNVKIIVWLLL